MITTLNKIKDKHPCSDGWSKLLKSLGKTKTDDQDLDLMHILKSNGIQDAVWTLRCFDYLDYCLFLADIAENVLHIYEKNNDSKAPMLAIKAIRDYKKGVITKAQLSNAYTAAADAAYTAADAAADAYADADAAADADADAAYAAADDAAYAAYAADAAAYAADADAAAAADAGWSDVERLFIKHFGGVSK